MRHKPEIGPELHQQLYRVGKILTVSRHIPYKDPDTFPEPIAERYSICYGPDEDELAEIGKAAYCMSRDRLSGRVLHDQQTELEIVETMRVKPRRGAQIVRLKGDLIAKIYDPFFYPDPVQDETLQCPVRLADEEYTRETTVYSTMDARYGGGILPKYHGSFSLDISFGKKSRPVRLIVLEYIKGRPMDVMARDPDLVMSQAQWLPHVKEIILAETEFYRNGIQLTDLYPRNVMICGHQGRNDYRLVLLDFAAADFLDFSEMSKALSPYGIKPDDNIYFDSHGRPVSPILRYNWFSQFACAYGFRHTFIHSKEDDWSKWMFETFKGSQAFARITVQSMLCWLDAIRPVHSLLKTELLKEMSRADRAKAIEIAAERNEWVPEID